MTMIDRDPVSRLRLLLQGGRAAFAPGKLVLAAMGLLLLHAGWSVLAWVFAGEAVVVRASVPPLLEWPSGAEDLGPLLREAAWRLTEPARALTTPLALLSDPATGMLGRLQGLLTLLWAVCVWGLVGGAIARASVLELARDGSRGLAELLRFAARFARPLILAPLLPLLLAGLLAAGAAAFGLVYWLPFGIGPVLGRALFFVPLVFGLVMALLLVGMVLGWPLMHAAVAANEDDEVEGLSRAFGYLGHRTGMVACLLVPIVVIGVVGAIGVDLLARLALQLGSWGASVGAPGVVDAPRFWWHAAELAAHAWAYSYAWTQVVNLYMILRRDVDGTLWGERCPAIAADPTSTSPATPDSPNGL